MSLSELIWSDMFLMVEIKALYWAQKVVTGGVVGRGEILRLPLLTFAGNLKKVLTRNE